MSTAWFDRWWRVAIFMSTLAAYGLFTPRVLRYTEPPSRNQPYYLQTVISAVAALAPGAGAPAIGAARAQLGKRGV